MRYDGSPAMMIRLNVRNYGFFQRDPPSCEVLVTKITFSFCPPGQEILMTDEARLIWKDKPEDRYRAKVLTNRLVDVCSVYAHPQPTISVWSEKGAAGYSINKGAGIYKFHVMTVCKGSSPASAVLSVSFDPSQDWKNVHAVSLIGTGKSSSYMRDACWIASIIIISTLLWRQFISFDSLMSLWPF
jgi:hypothetical protein